MLIPYSPIKANICELNFLANLQVNRKSFLGEAANLNRMSGKGLRFSGKSIKSQPSQQKFINPRQVIRDNFPFRSVFEG